MVNPKLFNLSMSESALPLLDSVKKHVAENVEPITEEFFKLGEGRKDRWSWAPGQLELLDGAKQKAKDSGLWNFFLPNAETGEGLSNLDYAYIAAELGKNPLASETLNCSAPDTGNMEVLERVGTPEQKEQWLKPLLAGEIRSAYAMTEPDLPSSDAKNISTSAVLEGDEWVINGEKFYISGAGDPRCKIMICMVKTSPDAAPINSNLKSWFRSTHQALRSWAAWRCSGKTMPRTVTCTSFLTMCEFQKGTSYWAKDVDSRFRNYDLVQDEFIIACDRSVKPKSLWK